MLAPYAHVLSWLERHAAAVQAVASIATVFITLALAWITRKYVLLTQEMALTAREQLRFQHHTERTDAAQLLTLIEVFLGYLKRLPMRDEDAEPLHDVSLWRHTDIRQFAALAAGVLGSAPIVHDAIQALNAIRARVDGVRQASRGRIAGPTFSSDSWRQELARARTALRAVRDAAESAEASLAERFESVTPANGENVIRLTLVPDRHDADRPSSDTYSTPSPL
jgi:hypothetical protein